MISTGRRLAMRIQILRLCVIFGTWSVLGACTLGHRIVGPGEPIKIEMTVLLQHKHTLTVDNAGG
jgi:hypothetical protein